MAAMRVHAGWKGACNLTPNGGCVSHDGGHVYYTGEFVIAGNQKLPFGQYQFNKQTGGALEFAGLSRSEIERAQLRAYVEVFARNGRWRDLASFVWRYRAAGLHLVRKAAAGERRPTPPPAPSPGSLDEIAAATARWSAAQSDGVRRLRASAELARARVEPAARAHAPVR